MTTKGAVLLSMVLMSFLFGTIVQCRENSLANKRAVITAVDVQPGEKVRAVSLAWWPDNYPRIVQVKALEASQSTGNTKVDAVEFVMSNILQTVLSFAYYHAEAQVPTDQNPDVNRAAAVAAFWIAARFFVVFEYNEGNQQPGYQPDSADNITKAYDLSHKDLQWKPITFETTQLQDSNGETFKVHTIAMETLDEVFLIKFVVTEKPVQVNGNRVNCDEVKVDFAIRWFNNSLHKPANWTTGPSDASEAPNAHLGVVAVTAAVAGAVAARENSNQDPALVIASGAYAGFFSWKPTADVTVQGATAARAVYHYVVDTTRDPKIQAAFAAGWVVRVLLFSFEANRPEEVYWDPTFGTTIDYKLVDSAAVSAFSAVQYLLLLLALLFTYLY
jgi:hypothetical protein